MATNQKGSKDDRAISVEDLVGPYRENLRFFLEDTDFKQGVRCLELGCGEGRSIAPLARAGLQVSGIDVSEDDLAAARRWFNLCQIKGEFIHGDVSRLGTYFAPESLEFIIDGLCLHCLSGVSRTAAIREIYQTLKGGGIFALQSACGEIIDAKQKPLYDPDRKILNAGTKDERYVGNVDDIISEFVEAGFRLKKKLVKTRQHPRETDLLLAAFEK